MGDSGVDIQEQIDRASWPPGVRVTAYSEGGVDGTVFRISARDGEVRRGLEIVLTQDAQRMYGEGPMVATVLQELQRHAERGLPQVQPGQEYGRLTYEGD